MTYCIASREPWPPPTAFTMILDRLLRPLREFGPAVGTLYIVDRMLRRPSARAGVYFYELVAQPVAAEPLLAPAHRRDLRWTTVTPQSPELVQMPRSAAALQARFDQGAMCIAVYRKEHFIGYAWFCFERYHEDEVRCVYVLAAPERMVFDFDVYIFPQYRIGRAFAAVWDSANEFLRQRGIEHTCSRISRFNLASRQAHARLGTRSLGHALFLRAGAWQFTLHTLHDSARGAPHIHLSRRAEPRLTL